MPEAACHISVQLYAAPDQPSVGTELASLPAADSSRRPGLAVQRGLCAPWTPTTSSLWDLRASLGPPQDQVWLADDAVWATALKVSLSCALVQALPPLRPYSFFQLWI